MISFSLILNKNLTLQVLSAHFRTYILALEKVQLDIATTNDLIGVEDTRSVGLFSRSREPLRNRSAVFALGDRAKVLQVKVWLYGHLFTMKM